MGNKDAVAYSWLYIQIDVHNEYAVYTVVRADKVKAQIIISP